MRSHEFSPLLAMPAKKYEPRNSYLDYLSTPIDVRRILTPITEEKEFNNPRFQQMRNNVILIDDRIEDIMINVPDVEPWETVYNLRNSTFRGPLTYYSGNNAPRPKLSPLATDITADYQHTYDILNDLNSLNHIKGMKRANNGPILRMLNTDVDLYSPMYIDTDSLYNTTFQPINRPADDFRLHGIQPQPSYQDRRVQSLPGGANNQYSESYISTTQPNFQVNKNIQAVEERLQQLQQKYTNQSFRLSNDNEVLPGQHIDKLKNYVKKEAPTFNTLHSPISVQTSTKINPVFASAMQQNQYIDQPIVAQSINYREPVPTANNNQLINNQQQKQFRLSTPTNQVPTFSPITPSNNNVFRIGNQVNQEPKKVIRLDSLNNTSNSNQENTVENMQKVLVR